MSTRDSADVLLMSASPSVRRHIKNGLICISVANLMFVRIWYDMRVLQIPEVQYLRNPSTSLGGQLLTAIAAAVFVLAALLWAGRWMVERSGSPLFRKLAYSVFLAMLIFPIESIRQYWNITYQYFDWGSNSMTLAIELTLAGGIVMVWRNSYRILKAARGAALLCVFLFPVTIAAFLGGFTIIKLGYRTRPNLPILSGDDVRGPRFLWVLMDEFDRHIAFEDRPASLQLPQLDRLSRESLVASHGDQVHNITLAAIPSLLTGRKTLDINATDANTLMITYPGQTQPERWSEQPSIFRRVHQQGFDSAVVGWFHPYCRVLGDQVASCFSRSPELSSALQLDNFTRARGIFRTVLFLFQIQGEHLVCLFTGEPLSGLLWLQSTQIQEQMQGDYRAIRDHAYQVAMDPSIEFGFLHFPTPHPLPIYNRAKKSFELDSSLTYLDNLALVDRTVGELRQKLEEAGLADRTTILITSDHGLRPAMWRGGPAWNQETEDLLATRHTQAVPFILKMAGDSRPVAVDTPFSTLLTGDLALAVLKGEVSTNQEAAQWLEAHAAQSSKDSGIPLAASQQAPGRE